MEKPRGLKVNVTISARERPRPNDEVRSEKEHILLFFSSQMVMLKIAKAFSRFGVTVGHGAGRAPRLWGRERLPHPQKSHSQKCF